jgi:hypothetical protein
MDHGGWHGRKKSLSPGCSNRKSSRRFSLQRVWDKVCGECGGKQQDLVEQRNAEHAAKREEAERLRAEYRFSEAIDLLKPLQSLEDQRFSDISEWTENSSVEIEEEAERRPRGVKKVERTPWPMISKVASATEPRFWVEIQAGLIVGGEKSGQNGRTAQQ